MNKFKSVVISSLLLVSALLFISSTMAQEGVSIHIPALGVQSAINEFPLNGTSWTINPWEGGLGHLQGTGWFGGPGNIAVGGHSWYPNQTPGIFVNLHTLTSGDEVVVHMNGQPMHYTVTNVTTVSMYDLTVLYPTGHEQLTLITCDAGSFDPASQLYQRRVIVQAQRTG